MSPGLSLALGALLISFAPILVKGVDSDALGPTGIGFGRALVGAGCLFLLVRLRGKPLALPRRLLGWSVLTGFLFALDLFVWHQSIVGCGAGMATILGNTQVFWTALLGRLVFGERLARSFFLVAALAMVGVVLLVGIGGDSVEFTRRYGVGVALGLSTGVVYAHFLAALKGSAADARRRGLPAPDAVTFMAYSSLFSALFLAPVAWFEEGQLWAAEVDAMVQVALLGVIAQAGGWVVIGRSLPHLPAARAGLILLLQPILATAWAGMLFGEHLAPLQLVGALLTLAAIYRGGLRT